jgi:ElaB/YqjD/DUF883 family membrane-anchored ribosome-binding protein
MSIESSNQFIDRAAVATDQAAANAMGAAQRGVAAVRESSHHLVDRAVHATDSTVEYIRDEPVKAMLIAAATGAALMAIMGMFTRSRHHRG